MLKPMAGLQRMEGGETPEMSPGTAADPLAASREAVRQGFAMIINKFIKQAQDGSYQHAKFLLEFMNETAGGVAREVREEESLAALLLAGLGEEPAKGGAAG